MRHNHVQTARWLKCSSVKPEVTDSVCTLRAIWSTPLVESDRISVSHQIDYGATFLLKVTVGKRFPKWVFVLLLRYDWDVESFTRERWEGDVCEFRLRFAVIMVTRWLVQILISA